MTDRPSAYDVIVVGAGPAGLAAAGAAAAGGQRVALLSEAPWLGGQIWHHHAAELPPAEARPWLERLRASQVVCLPGTAVVAAFEPGRLWMEREEGGMELRYERLILATGARELFLPFPGWTLPGVVGPGAAQALSKHGWDMVGKRVLVAGSGPLLWAAADGLKKRGAVVLAVAEQAPLASLASFGLRLLRYPDKLWQGAAIRARLGSTRFHFGTWVVRAEGDGQLWSATLTDGRQEWSLDCDLLACAYGLVPNTELAQALGCRLKEGFVEVDSRQATTVPSVYAAGELTGIGGADRALLEGQIAGHAAAGDFAAATALARRRPRWEAFRQALAGAFQLRPEVRRLATDDTIVCRCEDVSLGRLRPYRGWREAKLHSRCGMGPCQGRVCGAATRELFGWGSESVRPPVLPCRVSTLAAPPTAD